MKHKLELLKKVRLKTQFYVHNLIDFLFENDTHNHTHNGTKQYKIGTQRTKMVDEIRKKSYNLMAKWTFLKFVPW